MYERIKALCRRDCITIAELERRLNFSRGSLCKVDKNKPTYDRVQRIADYFGVSASSLTGEAEPTRHYIDDETLAIAQELHDDRNLRIMFNSAKNLAPEDLLFAKEMLLKIEKLSKR